MNWIAKTLTIAGTGLLLGHNLFAVIPDKYQTILDRNAFGLLPPPPIDPPQTNAPPPLNIKVTGFATIGGQKRVYFMIPPKDPKDTQQYINLTEGQREGSLEVVGIDTLQGEVRIVNAGADRVLSLEKDGIQPAKAAPGAAPAPMPMANPAGQVSPVYNPNPVVPQPAPGAPPVPPFPGQQNINPNNQPNIPPQGPQQNYQQQQQQQNQGGPEMRTIPTRTLRVPPVQRSQDLQPPMPE